jgi:hypothetical protein
MLSPSAVVVVFVAMLGYLHEQVRDETPVVWRLMLSQCMSWFLVWLCGKNSRIGHVADRVSWSGGI